MAPWLDARIPVLVGADPTPGDAAPGCAAPDCAVLVETGAEPPPGVPHAVFVPDQAHPAGCACCAARAGAAVALDRLFLLRARGELPLFRRVLAVVASPAGEDSIRSALSDDPVVSARFRLGPVQPS
jgi:hypothetical protein